VQKTNEQVTNSNILNNSARTQNKADEIDFKKSKKTKKFSNTNKKTVRKEKAFKKNNVSSKNIENPENIYKTVKTDSNINKNSTNSKNIQKPVKTVKNAAENSTTSEEIQNQIRSNSCIEDQNTSTIPDTTQKPVNATQTPVDTTENSNESELNKYLELFDENDTALIGTNVSNDEPIAAGGTTSLQSYLVQTAYCDVNSQTIRATAAAITRGKTSTYAKAVAIFNYVRDRTSYSFYYNTKKGALGTLTSRSANCVDHTHLLIALLRASGIPAKYVHVKAQFTSGSWYGHVYANVWVDGRWYSADATSNSNPFGVIKNWNLRTCTLKGIYASLPF
jgi:hypothetical protein